MDSQRRIKVNHLFLSHFIINGVNQYNVTIELTNNVEKAGLYEIAGISNILGILRVLGFDNVYAEDTRIYEERD